MKAMPVARREDDNVVIIINTLWLASYFGLPFYSGHHSTFSFVLHMTYQTESCKLFKIVLIHVCRCHNIANSLLPKNLQKS